MNKRVRAVENGQHSLVVKSEELLNIDLSEREEEAERTGLLKVENCDAVLLGSLPHAVGSKDELAAVLDTDVETQIDGPVEHLYKKGKLLDEPAVPVVCVAGRVWRIEDGAAAGPLLGAMFRGFGR